VAGRRQCEGERDAPEHDEHGRAHQAGCVLHEVATVPKASVFYRENTSSPGQTAVVTAGERVRIGTFGVSTRLRASEHIARLPPFVTVSPLQAPPELAAR